MTDRVVITGAGVVCPLGIGYETYWQALVAGRSGVTPVRRFDASALPAPFGGEVTDFDPKQYVRPRKSLKVMSRETQLAFTAADLARGDAGLAPGAVDPDRFGVVFAADMMYCDLEGLAEAYRSCMVDGQFCFSRWGTHALSELYPLWMLKYLPNMAACHIGIAQDARGPSNSISLGEASSLLALAEGTRVIERGAADVVIVGGTGSRLHPTPLAFRGDCQLSHGGDDPAGACRPFDALRDGMVLGEGAAAFVLESRLHAERRKVRIWCRVLGQASSFEPCRNGRSLQGSAVESALRGALHEAELAPSAVGHVNANGMSTLEHDRAEARAIGRVLADVPVTAPKSFFGNSGAGTGAVEMIASLMALREGLVPPTLNYTRPDPDCPVHVAHGQCQPARHATALLVNQSTTGQAAAIVLAADR